MVKEDLKKNDFKDASSSAPASSQNESFKSEE